MELTIDNPMQWAAAITALEQYKEAIVKDYDELPGTIRYFADTMLEATDELLAQMGK
jgi:hypothetical protein